MARAAASRLAAAATSSKSKFEVFSRHLAAASSAWGAPSRLPDPARERRIPSWWCPSRSFHATMRVDARDYYDVLGVSSDASASDIKKAYYGGKSVHLRFVKQFVVATGGQAPFEHNSRSSSCPAFRASAE